MCLSIPSRVTKIDKESNTATLDTMGVSREASLELMQDGSVEVGDYVLVHIGFIMNKIDKADALLCLEAFEEIAKRMEDDE
ncbi:MAG: HypC/HybG/HupF family hydrogenase formation chaperone [Sulfurimonas sp.]|uniref:HypC/HybG/HupF family hydrogenase formation chaperone n=1 Tax=Sulfurimonas sp. TaxID=2022749 RepID=UPI002632C299|nr:HypC/HybG/HupF family hydrogenase formation chaperone [Sulfurimonas sp.]MDD2653183.1 HypC/HybG/HupF family hydrogenase formation chaperone [Sulfurimonas sp.]MDD3450605.1 HypC/HybG/HupF family hydrogenase formation chaperone [Sulfurimonas sp.]